MLLNSPMQKISLMPHAPLKVMRETGVIERLMENYGFIACCERDSTVFFHRSQYMGSEALKVGMEVEFEVGTDKKNGKLIARRLVMLPKGSVSFEIVNPDKTFGYIIQESLEMEQHPKNLQKRIPTPTLSQNNGQIVVNQGGESFFIPYDTCDVVNNQKVKKGDKVSFYMAVDKRTHTTMARRIIVVEPALPPLVRGVINSLRSTYGFIDREDTVEEVYFHFTEFHGDINVLTLLAPVEFVPILSGGKIQATQVKLLPQNSVIIKELSAETYKGTVTVLPIPNGKQKHTTNKNGEIISDNLAGMRLDFSQNDMVNKYTLKEGDLVNFRVISDKRNSNKWATQVTLEEMIDIDTKCRERGIVVTVKDGYGFIRCAERKARIFFHFSEIVSTSQTININSEVEFSISEEPVTGRLLAIRVIKLPEGSIILETLDTVYTGEIIKEIRTQPREQNALAQKAGTSDGFGNIQYWTKDGELDKILYFQNDNSPSLGDSVQFHITQTQGGSACYAVDLVILHRVDDIEYHGAISALKDGFGFIEREDHGMETFFQYSSLKDIKANDLKLGSEVKYCQTTKNGKLSAVSVSLIPPGKVTKDEIQSQIYEGIIMAQYKSPEQATPGKVIPDETSLLAYPHLPASLPFSISGLRIPKMNPDLHQKVTFQICMNPITKQIRACNINILKNQSKRYRGLVETVKENMRGVYGFISIVGEESNFYFHQSAVVHGGQLDPGTEVECSLTINEKTGKMIAIDIVRLHAANHQRQQAKIKMDLHKIGDITPIRKPDSPYSRADSPFCRSDVSFCTPDMALNRPNAKFNRSMNTFNTQDATQDSVFSRTVSTYNTPIANVNGQDATFSRPMSTFNSPDATLSGTDATYNRSISTFTTTDATLTGPDVPFNRSFSTIDATISIPETSSFSSLESPNNRPDIPYARQDTPYIKQDTPYHMPDTPFSIADSPNCDLVVDKNEELSSGNGMSKLNVDASEYIPSAVFVKNTENPDIANCEPLKNSLLLMKSILPSLSSTSIDDKENSTTKLIKKIAELERDFQFSPSSTNGFMNLNPEW